MHLVLLWLPGEEGPHREQLSHDATHGKDVNRCIIVGCSEKDLGRSVPSSAYIIREGRPCIHLFSKSKSEFKRLLAMSPAKIWAWSLTRSLLSWLSNGNKGGFLASDHGANSCVYACKRAPGATKTLYSLSFAQGKAYASLALANTRWDRGTQRRSVGCFCREWPRRASLCLGEIASIMTRFPSSLYSGPSDDIFSSFSW